MVRIGALAAGQQVVYRITATAVGSPGQQLALRGTVTHSERDTHAVNDRASAVVQIIAPPQPPAPSFTG
jgi:hypothetical protein